MSVTNIRLMVFAIVVCLICASRTSIREQVLLHSYRKMQRLSLRSPSEKDLFEGAMEGMTEKLRRKYKDPYSYYENAENQKDINDQLENTLVGIGVFMEFGPEKSVLLYPLLNSPAFRSGILYGDRLIKVEGEDIAGLSNEGIASKIRGPEKTAVTITVKHQGSDEPVDVRIVRERQRMPTVVGDSLKHDGSWNYTLETNPEIGYLCLRDSFSDETPREMANALAALNRDTNVRGLILDIRGNPGGYLQSAVAVCELFLDEGTIVTVKRRDGSVKDTYKASGKPLWTKPVVLLINEGSASASEIVAACLQDHHRAIVVGERSYGKGTVQEIFILPMRLGSLRLTDAEYRRPSGENINRLEGDAENDTWGVLPDDDCRVPLSAAQETFIVRIRKLRSVIPENELDENVRNFVKRVTETGTIPGEQTANSEKANGENKSSDQEKEKSEESVSFQPQGAPPYYDAQLQKAIEMITESL